MTSAIGETHLGRVILRITGSEREGFLQGLVTNDAKGIDRLVYAALLTPQGKFITDFFLSPEGDAILLDVAQSDAALLLQKLKMYKLRADVQIETADLYAIRGLGVPPKGAFTDPRDAAMGWRIYAETPGAAPQIDWDAIRVVHCIPESGIELTPDSFILEAGFERLSGVDFRKGCYVGQEVTARMKHKTDLRKGLVTVQVNGPDTVPGTPIQLEDGREAGVIYTRSGGQAIAQLRFDRAAGAVMTAGQARVTWTP